MNMKNLYDVQQFLKRFGIIIYVGKRLYDIELMKIELQRLYDAGLMERLDYLEADTVFRRETQQELMATVANLYCFASAQSFLMSSAVAFCFKFVWSISPLTSTIFSFWLCDYERFVPLYCTASGAEKTWQLVLLSGFE